MKQAASGLFLPSKKKRVTIYFRGGGRTTIECESFSTRVSDFDGALIGIDYESESKFPYFKYEAVDAIEVIEVIDA